MRDYINYINKEYGIYIDLDVITDPFTLPDYMTVEITARTSEYGGENEVHYKFQTTTVTEHYLKKKIMEVVRMLNVTSEQDWVMARGDAKSMYTSIGSISRTIGPSIVIDYRRQIKKVIFNDPATIVFWKDGTKTVVKCQPGDTYDKMTGLAMACSKHMLGNKGNYYDIFKKWIGDDNET